jgi:hypothetical protein
VTFTAGRCSGAAFGVDDAAYRADRILRTRLVDPQGVAEVLANDGVAARRELADRFRAYVRHRSALAIEQRWFEDLAVLQARPEPWLDAAEQITSGLRGESLRARSAPSVSDLFATRIALADVRPRARSRCGCSSGIARPARAGSTGC